MTGRGSLLASQSDSIARNRPQRAGVANYRNHPQLCTWLYMLYQYNYYVGVYIMENQGKEVKELEQHNTILLYNVQLNCTFLMTMVLKNLL